MEEKENYKSFGLRVRDLRKQKKWTQKDLAAKLGIGFSQLNKYEGGLHIPPANKLVQLAELFNTTVDYLLIGNSSEETPLHNNRILERFRALENFDADEQETVIKLIDAMIIKHRVEGALKPLDKAS